MPAQSLTSLLKLAHRRVQRLSADESGQDLIEYALLVGFVTVAAWAFFPSNIFPSISHIFSRLMSTASVLVP